MQRQNDEPVQAVPLLPRQVCPGRTQETNLPMPTWLWWRALQLLVFTLISYKTSHVTFKVRKSCRLVKHEDFFTHQDSSGKCTWVSLFRFDSSLIICVFQNWKNQPRFLLNHWSIAPRQFVWRGSTLRVRVSHQANDVGVRRWNAAPVWRKIHDWMQVWGRDEAEVAALFLTFNSDGSTNLRKKNFTRQS